MNAWPRKERPGDVSRKLSTSETTKRGSGDPEIERGVKLVEQSSLTESLLVQPHTQHHSVLRTRTR